MKMGIQGKITLIILLVIIISITSIGVLNYKHAKVIVLNEVKQSSYETLQNANDYFLKKFMSDMEHVVNYWAENEQIKNYKSKPNQPKMVRAVPERFKYISDQWLGYVKGSSYIEWIYFEPEEDGSLFISPIDPTMPDEYDCRTRDWYRKAVQNRGKAVWSDPYLDAGETGGIVVTVARAVERGNELVGVVGMDIKLSRFSNIINDIRYGDGGYLMLLNSEGYLFSHPNDEMLLSNISSDEELAKDIVSESGIDIIDYQGKQKIISYLSVPDTGWKLVGVMSFDMEKALEPIRDETIRTALYSVFIAFIIGFLLSEVIINPLHRIMKSIHNISLGNLYEHIDIKSKDEFEVLGNQFNDMMDSLRELIQERNKNVEELTRKNEEILSQSKKISSYSREKELMNRELSGLLKEIRSNYLSTVRALANAIEASDKYTRGHCDRVSRISMAIAKNMGVSSEDQNILEFASILHDIGKIGVSSHILNKEGKLTEEEVEMIRRHPKIGYDILSGVEFLYESRKILLQHHERIDGEGYPQGLKGDEITFLAKIISVADAYDAMTSSRPYRKNPLTQEQAIQEMIRLKGIQFDGEVVDCFVNLLMTSPIAL